MNRTAPLLPSSGRSALLPSRVVRHFAFKVAFLVLAFTGIRSSYAQAKSGDQLPLELRPYRVQLLVAFDAPQMPRDMREGLLRETQNAAGRSLGGTWQLSVAEAPWLQPATRDGLSRLEIARVCELAERSVEDADVWMVAACGANGSGWTIDLRSWQPEVGVHTGLLRAQTYDRFELPQTLVKLCFDAWRPVGVVDEVDGKTVRIAMQAGGLSVPDEAYSVTGAAKMFVPVLASRKDHRIERLQTIPWTYLVAGEIQGPRITCELNSGLRSPIGGKKRGRVETLAIAVKPAHGSTRLELATQVRPSLPLVAHRIELRKSAEIPRPEDAAARDERLLKVLLTDRRGRVTIPADSSDVVWLFAYSGQHLLARVPMLPGIAESMRLEVPDDAARLDAESNLHQLQGILVEAVASRNTVAARARAAIKKNEVDKAKAAAAELKELPGEQFYLNKVIAIRVPAVKAAKSRRDRAGEARINRMCDEMVELIKQYLGEDKRQAIFEELKELTAEDPAAEEPAKEP